MKKIIFIIMLFSVSLSLLAEENHKWLTENNWCIEDGRSLAGLSMGTIDFHSNPRVIFRVFEKPPRSVLYQVQLRNELFYFLYQKEDEQQKFVPIGSAYGTDPLEIEFSNNNSSMTRKVDGYYYGSADRVGKQQNHNYPLVGIWGRLPFLNEYQLVDPAACVLYMEIIDEIPVWAVRKGTYLIKQTGEKTFETISSYPEGRLKLEVLRENIILLTPLFSSTRNEVKLVAPLAIRRN